MAVQFVAIGAYTNSAGSLSVAPPVGVTAGNLLVLMVSAQDTINDINGWTPISDVVSRGSVKGRAFYKFASSSEGNVTVDDYGSSQRAIMSEWSGVDTTNPINAYTTNLTDSGSTTLFDAANPTSTIDGCMLVNFPAFYDGDNADTSNYTNWANTSLVSITEGYDRSDTAGSGGGIAFAYGIKTSAGAINNTTATRDNAAGAVSSNTNFLLTPIQTAVVNSNFFIFL